MLTNVIPINLLKGEKKLWKKYPWVRITKTKQTKKLEGKVSALPHNGNYIS